MKKVIDTFNENVKLNVEGYIGVSITEIQTGISYSTESINGFDIEKASEFNAVLVKAKLDEINALGLNNRIHDITIKLKSQAHIINISPNNSYFIYLAIDSKRANIRVAKSLLNKYKQELYKTL